jgi:hypothetical protein
MNVCDCNVIAVMLVLRSFYHDDAFTAGQYDVSLKGEGASAASVAVKHFRVASSDT